MFVKGTAITNRAEPGGIKHEAINFRETEDALIENIELKHKVLKIAETILPLLTDDAMIGDVHRMIERSTPVAFMRLLETVVNGKGAAAAKAATEILHMGGHKPVEKSINVHENIDRMSEQQLDAFINNAVKGMKKEERESLVQMIEAKDGSYIPVEVEQEEL